jgi:hypothetical protein
MKPNQGRGVGRVTVLIILACVISLYAQTSLLSEDFEDSFLPEGWDTSQTTGLNQWFRNDYWERDNFTLGEDGYCADNDDNAALPSRAGNNALISPAFDASEYTTVWLAYDVDWYPADDNLEGRVDVYDGSSWVTVMTHPETRKTERDSIHVSDEVAGVSNAQIRFVYHETSGGVKSKWYQVDDVAVWGSTEPTPLDLEMVEIIRPEDREEPEVSFKPKCKIYNNQDTTVHARIICTIKDLPEEILQQGVVYGSEYPDYPLTPGYNYVEFEEFTPMPETTYNAFFEVEHPDDVDENDNSEEKNFSTAEKDVTPYKIVSPGEPVLATPFKPTAMYTERSNRGLENVTMRCWIKDMIGSEIVYSYALEPRTFEPYDTVLAVFETAKLEGGRYIIRFWATDENLINLSNPPLEDTFEYLGVAEKSAEKGAGLDATPNLFSGSTVVRFSLASPCDVSLRVYDAAGNLVTVLVKGTYTPGQHEVTWGAHDVTSGVYFIRFITPGFSAARKVVVLK